MTVSATVNHQVGGSSPSRGAISNLQLTVHHSAIGADQETNSHRVGSAIAPLMGSKEAH